MTAADLVERLRAAAGTDGVLVGDAARAYGAGGLTPACVALPDTVEALERCMAVTHAAGAAVIPAGSGTRLDVGHLPVRYDVAVSTRRLGRVQAHDDADMTVTVDAGITLADLNGALAAAGQWLPLDPPCPDTATVGAVVATDASGPLRLSQGKVRDLLIGITVVLADGTRVRGGGRVVKNVAGYDLMKLFSGSHGTLGVVAGASFKVRPRPAQRALLLLTAASLPAAIALAVRVLDAPVAPLYVEALNAAAAAHAGLPAQPIVAVGLGGSSKEIEVQMARLHTLAEPPVVVSEGDPDRTYGAVRDLPAAAVCGATASVLPRRLGEFIDDAVESSATSPALVVHVGSGVVRLCWLAPPADPQSFAATAERLRAVAAGHGGWLVFDTLPSASGAAIDPWGAGIPGVELMRGIKRTLDPGGRLSPGRFVDRM